MPLVRASREAAVLPGLEALLPAGLNEMSMPVERVSRVGVAWVSAPMASMRARTGTAKKEEAPKEARVAGEAAVRVMGAPWGERVGWFVDTQPSAPGG